MSEDTVWQTKGNILTSEEYLALKRAVTQPQTYKLRKETVGG